MIVYGLSGHVRRLRAHSRVPARDNQYHPALLARGTPGLDREEIPQLVWPHDSAWHGDDLGVCHAVLDHAEFWQGDSPLQRWFRFRAAETWRWETDGPGRDAIWVEWFSARFSLCL